MQVALHRSALLIRPGPGGLPRGDRGGQALAAAGVAGFVVAGAADRAAVADRAAAGRAAPSDRRAIGPVPMAVRWPGRVAERGLGDRLPGAGVPARWQAQRGADLGPAVAVFAGGTDVAAGEPAGGQFGVPGGAQARERLSVTLGGAVRVGADDRPGDELAAGAAHHALDGRVHFLHRPGAGVLAGRLARVAGGCI